MPESKPRMALLPALMFAAGLGMLMFYGHAWWRLPVYSEDDIVQSVDLNLAIDLQRREASFTADAANVARLREQVQTEVVAAIDKDLRDAQRYFGMGVLLLVVSLIQMVIMRRMAAR